MKQEQRTGELQGQQLQYADVREAQHQLELGEAAIRVGGSTEIDWQDYLLQLQASLPAGVTLQDVSVDSIGVMSEYAQSDVPLEGARIATLTYTAQSATLPTIPDWLDRLRGLPGFVDATPGSVTLQEGVYTASITMHIDSSAYSNRLTKDEDAETTDAGATGTDTTGTETTEDAK